VDPTVPEQVVDELYSVTPTKTPLGTGVHAALQEARVVKQVDPPHVAHPVIETDPHDWHVGPPTLPDPFGQKPSPRAWQISHWLKAKEEKRESIKKLSNSVDIMFGSVKKERKRE